MMLFLFIVISLGVNNCTFLFLLLCYLYILFFTAYIVDYVFTLIWNMALLS